MAIPGLGRAHFSVQSSAVHHRRLFARTATYDGAKILLHSLRHCLISALVAFSATNVDLKGIVRKSFVRNL